MPDAVLRIERLVIRVRGQQEQSARQLASAVGPAILQQVGAALANGAVSQPSARITIESVDAGTVPFGGPDRIAAGVTRAITRSLAAKEDA